MTTRIIILTGERGVGKSTVCRETIALAQSNRFIGGGILTLSHPNGAMNVLDIHSGYAHRLTVGPDVSPAVPQGRFRFDPQTLLWGNNVLAHTPSCHLFVVDELGPLELERRQGWQQAFGVLHKGDFELALVVVRPSLVIPAQLRLPSTATTVLTVTLHNRDVLPSTLLEVLKKETDLAISHNRGAEIDQE